MAGEKAPAKKAAPKVEKPKDVGQSEIQKMYDDAHAQGFFGQSADPTPNAHYTVSGVLAGKPTPETDYDAAVEAVKTRVAGVEGVQPPST